MKQKGFNGKGAEECEQVDWGQFADEVSIGNESSKKDEYDWDFRNVKTDWAVDFDEKGRQIQGRKGQVVLNEDEIKRESSGDNDDLFASNIVSETLAQIASEDIYKADAAFVTGEIDAKAVNKAAKKTAKKEAGKTPDELDEDAIRKSVDDKIIIKSEELKAKRASNSGKKVKVRIRKEDARKDAYKRNESEPLPSKEKKEKAPKKPKEKKEKNKYINTGVIPSSDDGASQFRKDSANWRYNSMSDVEDDELALTEEKSRTITPVQYICAAIGLVVLVAGVMSTAVYANYKSEMNKAAAFAKLPQFVDSEMVAYEDDYAEEEVDLEEFTAEAAEDEHRVLSLVLTSVEKDLKIKLVDDEDTLVKGIDWSVTVKDSEGDEEQYSDDDRDGIIHISDISAGDYTVTIDPSESLSGYDFPTIGQEVSVKAKVEYKVIANIKDEIKKESEVNVALEDPNGGKGAYVETGTALKDTVEWVESTETSQGDEYEEAEVDLSRTENLLAFIERIKMAAINLAGNVRRMFDSKYVVASSVIPVIGYPDGETVESEIPGDENQIGIEVTPTPTTTPTPTPTPNPTDGDGQGNNDEDSPLAIVDVESATLNKTEETIYVGDKFQLSVTYKPVGAKPKKVVWMTDDDSIAGISEDGTVVGKAEGKVQVGVLINNSISLYCDVTVKVKESDSDGSVVLSGPTTIKVGGTASIEATCSSDTDSILEWKSLDETKATVIPNGNQVTVKGISAGTVRIQASSKEGIVAYFDINVSEDAEYSDDAQLYDSSKNKLYVFDNFEYRLAKYADYKSGNFDKFYRKIADVVYTGWQTIDGLTYYFTESHEKVTGDQVIGGVTYHFGADGALSQGSGTLGIDVSKYQPSINWSSVKASGVNYVIIRCGYRGASTGALIQDPCFYSHLKGAKDAGLKVGVYFFSTALNEAEAVEEASMCAALCSGYGINYPVFIDVESSSRPGYNTLSVADRTANIKAFCSTIQSAGYTPGLYANKTWLTEYINTSSLSCKIWLAQYNAEGPTYQGHYDLWQYTSKGSVDGISGNVDMNQSYLGY